jgi:hypothetical protein
MRTLAIFAVLGLAVSPALADPPARPAAPAPVDAKPATCKRVIHGKGLDRHVVCELETVVVHAEAPRPTVLILHQDPRNVVGRPRSADRLAGLSHELR